MAAEFQEREFPEGASPRPRARRKHMELWFALKVTQSHFYHILLIVSHKILPQFKRHGQRPSHVIGTCRMRDNGRDTALENMPPLLSGSSLSFTTVVPILLNCGFTPSSVSLVWGPLCGRELRLGHIQKFTAAWLLRTVQALPWAPYPPWVE